jgi:hypothetical protein
MMKIPEICYISCDKIVKIGLEKIIQGYHNFYASDSIDENSAAKSLDSPG